MKRDFEKKIRTNAVLIYIIVALLSGGILTYFYTQKALIGSQKQNIEESRRTLALTNKLIAYVNQAQATANLYIASKKPEHINLFTESMAGVQSYIDSLQSRIDHGRQDTVLLQIEDLLSQKAATIAELNVQFESYSLADSLRQKLESYSLSLLKDTALLNPINTQKTTTTTSIKEGEDVPQKGFFKRLAEAFVPVKTKKAPTEKSSVTTESTVAAADTIVMMAPVIDTKPILADLLTMAHRAGQRYERQISTIEKQVAALMTSDQEISVQLSQLLIGLHERTIESTLQEIRRNEELVQRNYSLSVVGIIGSLILGLVLILFIIKYAEKAARSRRAIEQINEFTKATMESRHRLLLSVSHDVKTPLNSILGYLSLWEHGHTFSEKEIKTMRKSGQHILDMLDNLLEFSRLEQGLQQASCNTFGLHEFCVEITDLFQPLTDQKKLRFETRFDFDRKLLVNSDKLKLQQIAINLLSNAIKYTTTGAIQFHVSYRNECIYLDINDTGSGIPANLLDSVYEPFLRIEKNNALAHGSGFGLYVVKGFVELLKGTVDIRSTVNKGTEVTVMIPAKEVTPTGSSTPKKILVVDDDESFLSVMQEMLSLLGHHQVDTCHLATGCEEHEQHLAEYDVVLTDAEMGPLSGADILQKVKAKNAAIPVILMTGLSSYNTKKALQAGFDGFLQKPVTIASLQQVVGGTTDARNSSQSLEELFGDDKEAIRRILLPFVETTRANVGELHKAIGKSDFDKAQAICHRMLSMFSQLGATDAVAILKKMDAMRGKSAKDYPQWKDDMHQLIKLAEELTAEEEIRAL